MRRARPRGATAIFGHLFHPQVFQRVTPWCDSVSDGDSGAGRIALRPRITSFGQGLAVDADEAKFCPGA